MAASVRKIIRQALPEIIQSKEATTGERLKACKLLQKIWASDSKGKPRGRAFTKKVTDGCNCSKDRLSRILSAASRVSASGQRDEHR
jgi:hypothetical protein